MEERVLDLIQAHRSTIVFANSRRLAERLCGRLNELASERAFVAAGGTPGEAPGDGAEDVVIARAHHGSVSRQERSEIEEALKAGRLPAVVATSSLELGIDMGAVDLVIQVESPPSVASGLQRVGRAGHNVGDVSRGVFFPKYAADLVQAAVVADRMQAGAIEELRIPRNPLDVLAQHIVAMTAMDDWPVDELEATIRRCAPFATLTRAVLEAVLDMLAGRYPGEEFAGLRPRIVWDRVAGVIHGRPGAQKLAVTSGGTIPDRGYFGVFLPAAADSRAPRRVGELDEEMVYESRVGDVFVLGASSWRIEDITPDRVIVLPAPGQPGKLPFWHGDTPGRPAELGRALGARVRELAALPEEAAIASLTASGLDPLAAGNLVSYLTDQREATGHVPDDRTLVVERFRDELGDWRVVLHSPYGDRVHAPWALAITARLRERYGGMDVQALHTDDGIIIRVPDSDEPPPAGIALIDPEEIADIITAEVGGSALFASRFRECAARALLLPRRQPGRRTPLWQQRQRSAQLLEIASQFPGFPITLETVRECLQDVFDVPALTEVLRDLAARRIRLVEVETATPSPFGRNLLFRYVGAFMYEGDAPLAERRAQALALDPALLAELLGTEGLRELLDPAVVAETEADLQHLSESRRCRDAEAVADLLRTSGPLTAARSRRGAPIPRAAADWLAGLSASRRAIEVRVAGQPMWAAIEDAGRLRDALGVALPVGIPEAFTEPLPDPLGDLVARWARTHGPFAAAALAERYGLGVAVVAMTLRRLAADGRVAEGEFLAEARGTQWCDSGVLRTLRRRCLARLRKEAEPVPPAVLGRFLPAWHGIGSGRSRRARRGRGPGGDRAAGGRAGARLGPGDAGAAGPGARLLPRAAGRAHLGRRGGLGGRGIGRQRRRLAGARARRVGPAAAARAGRAEHDAAARGGADRARRRRRNVLPHAQRPGRGGARRAPGRRPRPRRGALGPDLGGPGHQRHPGAAARGDRGRYPGPAARRAAAGRQPVQLGGGTRRRAAAGLRGRRRESARPAGPRRGQRPLPGCSTRGPRARPAAAAATPGQAATAGAAAGRAMPTRTGPPTVSGRWSLLPERHGLPEASGPREPLGGGRPGPGARPAGGHHAGPRARADPARAARRGDQGRGRGRADPGRVRRRVPGAAGDGGDRPVPPRVLRRRARRRPVRAARRGRPDARPGRGRPGRRAPGRGAAGPGPAASAEPLAWDPWQAAPADAAAARRPGGAKADDSRRAVVLAAADPAQPYGAALAWPARPGGDRDLAPARAQGGRGRGAVRGRAGAVRRARRQDAAVLDRGPGRARAVRPGAGGGGARRRAGPDHGREGRRRHGRLRLAAHPRPGVRRLPAHPPRPAPARLTRQAAAAGARLARVNGWRRRPWQV